VLLGVVALLWLAALIAWAMARGGDDNSDGEDGL